MRRDRYTESSSSRFGVRTRSLRVCEELNNPLQVLELVRLFVPAARLLLLTYVSSPPRHLRATGFSRLPTKAAASTRAIKNSRIVVLKSNQRIHTVLPSFPRCVVSVITGSGRGEEPSGGECPPPDSDPFNDVEF